MGTYRNIFLTHAGTTTLRGELRGLRRKLSAVSEDLKQARDHDGEFENGDWEVAENEYRLVNQRIHEINRILDHARPLRPSNGRKLRVALGSRVRVRENGDIREYRLVSSVEADPELRKISDESPLGRALLDSQVGDQVEVETPSGRRTYSILDIF